MLSGVGVSPALAAPSRVVITPLYQAVARGDDATKRVSVDVLDETGSVIEGAERSITITADADCRFGAGEAPSVRICNVTATYPGLPAASASLQIYDLSVFSLSVTSSSPVIAPGVVLTASSPPADWPALTYTWRTGRTASVGSGPAYTITMEDIGTTISVNARLDHGGMADHYRDANWTASAPAAADKATPQIQAKLTASVVNTKRKPTVDVAISVPGIGLRPGAVSVMYGSAKLDTHLPTGQGRITLPRLPKGSYAVTVWFQGDEQVNAASAPAGTLRVAKAVKPKLKASLAKSSVKRTARAKLRIAVTAKGTKKPSGTVTIRWGKGASKTAVFALKAAKKGKATFTLPKIKKKGKYKVTIAFTGNGKLTSASARRTLKVK
jgi:hypothetical protein